MPEKSRDENDNETESDMAVPVKSPDTSFQKQQTATIEQAIQLALQHHKAGRFPQAENIYKQVLQADPCQPIVLHQLGVIAHETGNNVDAIDFISKALAIKPDYTKAYFNLGCILKEQGCLEEAVSSYQLALAIDNNYAMAHYNLGNVYAEMRRLDEAIASYQKARAIEPSFAEVHYNIAKALHILGKLDEAVASYREALAIRPDFVAAHSNLAYSEQFRAGVNPEKLIDVHAEWDKQHGIPLKTKWLDHVNISDPDKCLRIGLVSADLGHHPVGYFVANLLACNYSKKFKFICYSDRVPDNLTERLMVSSDEWVDTRNISDEAMSQRIRSDQIDVLIDLAGHTAQNRLLVFARKPAPIQITWAGYVGTTGLSAMDYLIADYQHVPEGAERYYSEKVIRLPDSYVSYFPPDYVLQVGPVPFKQNGFITFGCFNNPAKINGNVLSAWADILKVIPNSRLILKYGYMNAEGNRERILDHFGALGVESSRLILEGWSPHSELLSRYNEIDIALDTFPYSGGLTTCEALWMGVPVITLPGDTFAGRHSLSHLTIVGIPELVASDLQNYTFKAKELAHNVSRLEDLRFKLRDKIEGSALCDGEKFATNFTSAIRDVWREWCR